jgi:hypothetical protein
MMPGWRERLIAAADADGRSDRAISLDAKLGENFMNQLRNSPKEPGVKQVLKLADTLNVSLSNLFLGAETTAEDEEFLQLLRSTSETDRSDILSILRARRRLRSE